MKFQTKIIKQYESDGWIVLKTIRLNKNGYPDLLCMKLGEVDTWIEIKEGTDTLKPLQKIRIDELISLGKNAFCLHDVKGIIYPSKC
jgi:hypothetical protein